MKKRIGNEKVFAVVSSMGGTVTNFVWHGSPIIYPEKIVGEKLRGGIPICFPCFGKPASMEYSEIPQHGWLRKQELGLIEESEMCVVFRGRNDPTKAYPWLMEYDVSVSIDPERGMDLKLVVRRLASDGCRFFVPVNPGFHPYFSNLGSHIAVVGEEMVSAFSRDARKVKSNDSIHINSGRWLLQMELKGVFDANSCLVLWSDDMTEYFCVEPVLTYPGWFADPEGGKFLRPDEQFEMLCSINIIA